MNQSRYDPFKHHRRSVRYADWDYRTPGYYFITICTKDRQNLFDNDSYSIVAEERLLAIPTYEQFQHVALDQWVVMPNHIHLILWLMTWPESIIAQPNKSAGFTHVQAGSVGVIVSTYKAQVTRRINNIERQKGLGIWQKGYWDRIVRDEHELNRTRQYIIDNPVRWQEDRENLNALLNKMTFHNET